MAPRVYTLPMVRAIGRTMVQGKNYGPQITVKRLATRSVKLCKRVKVQVVIYQISVSCRPVCRTPQCIYPLLSIVRFSLIQLSELEQCRVKKLAQGFNTAAQDLNPGPLSRESEALPLNCSLKTPETRRLRRDQIEVFEILNGYENIDRNIIFSVKKDRTRGHEVTISKGAAYTKC